MKKVNIFLLVLVCFILNSCGEYNKVVKSTSYDYKYAKAKQYFVLGQYNRSSILLQDVIINLKGTSDAEESLFLLGMSNYYAGDCYTASTVLRKYYKKFPKGMYTEESYFYSGKALYLTTPEPKLDQTQTYEALTEFQNFIATYPNSYLREEAQKMVFTLQDKLIEKEYLAAKLYYNLGSYFGNCTNGGSNYNACIITSKNAIQDYPYMKKKEEFSFLILESKLELAEQSIENKKIERYNDAIDEYYGFTNEFPESKYMEKAKNLFDKAQEVVNKKNK